MSSDGLEDLPLIDLFRAEAETHMEVLNAAAPGSGEVARGHLPSQRDDRRGPLDQGGCGWSEWIPP